MAASDTSQWLQDWGTLSLAGLAAIGAVANFVVALLHRRTEWLRALRVPRYAEFVRTAVAYFHTQVAGHPELAEGKRLVRESHTAFQAAYAEVLIVGPAPVSIAANIASAMLQEVSESPADVENHLPLFSSAIDDFIEAASAALGVDDNKNTEIDYARWKELRAAEVQKESAARPLDLRE